MKSNAFATRFVAPGALAWRSDDSLQQVEQRFREQCKYRGAIIGPHGSGKSTLLEHLVPRLGDSLVRQYSDGTVEEYSRGNIVWLSLRRRSNRTDVMRQYWQHGRLLVIDGFEQLTFLSRARVILETRRKQVGLLVTSHSRCLLRPVVRTSTSHELLTELTEELLHRQSQTLDSASYRLLRIAFAQANGNIREAFMNLYDQYELHKLQTTPALPKPTKIDKPVPDLSTR